MSLPKSLKPTPKRTITKKATPKTLPLPVKKKALRRAPTSFLLNVRSRHPSHSPLKKMGIKLPFRSVVRFGSTWAGDGRPRVEINSANAVRTSADKQLMKAAFTQANVKTAMWLPTNQVTTPQSRQNWINQVGFPIVAKHIHGSRGTGNYLLKTQAELDAWLPGKTLTNYIFEKFYDYNREYRLHVTKNGCFYTCRKMLKQDTPENQRWFRNDSNSVWIVESNPQFDKPSNWNAIVQECIKALTAVGLDVGAIDVRVQSAKTAKGTVRPNPEFIILETNSAPSFGEVTLAKYTETIPQLLIQKRNGPNPFVS